jgi:TetR/AcrR family transcriptional regulator, regulator of autoinduction and epiphytic fitness
MTNRKVSADPRIERSRRLVLEAAIAELASAGYGAFTIEAVAERSGVAKSTIYRHWPGKLPLIADAFERLNQQPGPVFHEGSVRQRVRQLLQHLVAVMQDATFSACICALVDAAEHDRQVRKFQHRYSERRFAKLAETITQGVASGELPSQLDPQLAALALCGPIFYRRLMTSEPMRAGSVDGLIETVLGSGRGASE